MPNPSQPSIDLPSVCRGNPFAAEGEWLRGNTHTHTTASDGKMTVPEAAAWYEAQGYDFLCITDHDVIAELDQESGSQIVLIPGAEIMTDWPEAFGAEICALGITQLKRTHVHPQLLIDDVLAQGGVPFMSHPHMSGVHSGLMMKLEGLVGIEVFNAHCYGTRRRGFSTTQWDELLTVGKCVWGCAADDRHTSNENLSDSKQGYDQAKAWVMVKAGDNSPHAILNALRDGMFYSTTGPEIKDIQIIDDHIVVRTSPVKSVQLTSLPWCGSRRDAPPGERLTEARIHVGAAAIPSRARRLLKSVAPTADAANPKTANCYFRIECWDGEDGWAWANPWIWETLSLPPA